MMTEETLVIKKGRVARKIATESLARTSWSGPAKGYANLISLGKPEPRSDLFAYRWGDTDLILTEPGQDEENLFELDAREILLFKRHPEATSARNLLKCTIKQIFTSGNRVRVELECGGQTLIAQIVPESVRELGIKTGCQVIAAIKASAFERIF
jgi:molybdate transport system ATP-binding protein